MSLHSHASRIFAIFASYLVGSGVGDGVGKDSPSFSFSSTTLPLDSILRTEVHECDFHRIWVWKRSAAGFEEASWEVQALVKGLAWFSCLACWLQPASNHPCAGEIK
jgi:hypothetical protein